MMAEDPRRAAAHPSERLPDHVPDEAAITRQVHAFYAHARHDWLLGPVFESAIGDWDGHLDTLVRFWCSVLLRAGSYRGNPMSAHRPLGLDDQHFARWLALWDRTARDVLTPAQARHVFETAQRIGRSLRVGLELDPLRRLRRAGDARPPCAHGRPGDDGSQHA
jgi:hemoglobin